MFVRSQSLPALHKYSSSLSSIPLCDQRCRSDVMARHILEGDGETALAAATASGHEAARALLRAAGAVDEAAAEHP